MLNVSFFIKVLVSYHKLLRLFSLNNNSKFFEKEKGQKKLMVLWLQNMEILSRQFFFSDVRQIQKQSCNLTLSFSVPHCAVDNTVPPSDSNISKTVGVNVCKRIFNKLSNGVQVDGPCSCDSQVIDV